MSNTSATDTSSEGPSIVDAVGFVGSEFDPGVWAVGEADPFGEVWVNVESGVVVESLGGAVIDPSEIDGRVDIEYMPSAPVGVGRELSDFDRSDLEFDPETGAFIGRGHDGGFEVVGWTVEAADEVGWVSGVGFYHAGTGEWYDAGLNVVEGGLAEGGRYVSLDEFSDEQREQVLRDAGMTGPMTADEAGELFFDPVTGTLHAYDPEEWAYDGSTWVNLENGATAESPTGDETGRYDQGDLRTLQQEGGVDAVGFVGSEFDPGVWAVGEADPFGEVWVNVESGVVVESLGGAVIDPSEIDGRVDIEYMPSAPVGVGRELSDFDRSDLEFDPETGAFIGRGHDGGFEVVGWTVEAADEVGWVSGVGFYHAGTGEWYDAGLNVVEGGLAEGGRYVSLDEFSDEQREQVLRDAGMTGPMTADEAGELFFDPVTGTLHAYDPEEWAYDGSTWVNLENGATAESPTGDETGRYDQGDLRTLQQEGGVDAVGFVGSEFDPGVWAVGEADPFGEVWVNVESGVVVESLGGAVIDPSEIDGRVDIEYMPSAPVGVGRELSDFDRSDLEFDPETGAFIGRGHDGGFEVVGWTVEAADEVGWVSGVGFYHAGTGEWYDAGLNVVEGGLAEGGRYVSLDEFSDEQREQVLRDAGMTGPMTADEAGELFFDPVTGTLHAYDPEEWAYDGSTWVNLENGATAESPTGDETGRYDQDDLETLREQAEGEEPAEREPAREADGTATEDAPEEEVEPDAPDAGEPPLLEPDETAPEPNGAEPTEATTEQPTAVEAEPEPAEAYEPEAVEAVEEAPTAEVGAPEPLDVHEPDADDGTPPDVPAEAESEVIVAPTETPTAEVYEPGTESEDLESFEERTTEAYEPQPGEPIGGGSPEAKDEPETMEGIEPDAVVAEPKPAADAAEPESEPATERSPAQTTEPESELGEAGGSAPPDVTKLEPDLDVGVAPPPAYSPPPDFGSLHAEYGPDSSDEGLTAEEIAESIDAAQDTDSVDVPDGVSSGEAPGHDPPGWIPESSPAEPSKPEPEPGVSVTPPESVPPMPDLDGDHPMEHLVPPERRGVDGTDETPPAESAAPADEVAEESAEVPTVDLHESEPAPEEVAAPTDELSAELHDPEPEAVAAPTETPTAEAHEPEPEPEPDVEAPAPDVMRGVPEVEIAEAVEESGPEVLEAPTEIPTVDLYEPEPDPEVVVAPTETPVAEVYESESAPVVAGVGGMREVPVMELAPDEPEPEVVVAPTETPTAEVYEPEPDPEVVVAPTDTPVADVYESESAPVVAGVGGMREVPVMELAPDEPEPEVVVAPTETPTAEVYESEPEPEVVVAPTETPVVDVYEPLPEPTATGEDWKGFDAGGVKAADDQGFGEWAPVEPHKETPSESISDPGEVIGIEPQPVEIEQTPISWDAAPESEVDDFDVELIPTDAAGIIRDPVGGGDEDDVELVPTEAAGVIKRPGGGGDGDDVELVPIETAGIIKQPVGGGDEDGVELVPTDAAGTIKRPVGGGDEDLEPTGSMPPVIQDPVEVLSEPVPIETDLVTFEEPLENLDADLSATPIHEEPLPPPKDVVDLESSDLDDGDYVDE